MEKMDNYFFSTQAAIKNGYIVATCQNGEKIMYTIILKNEDATYNYSDKKLVKVLSPKEKLIYEFFNEYISSK
jgi:hypothetical protein